MKELSLDFSEYQGGHWIVDVTNQSQSSLNLCLDVDGCGEFMFWSEKGSFAIPLSVSLDASGSIRFGLSSVNCGEFFDVTASWGENVCRKRVRASCFPKGFLVGCVFLFLWWVSYGFFSMQQGGQREVSEVVRATVVPWARNVTMVLPESLFLSSVRATIGVSLEPMSLTMVAPSLSSQATVTMVPPLLLESTSSTMVSPSLPPVATAMMTMVASSLLESPSQHPSLVATATEGEGGGVFSGSEESSEGHLVFTYSEDSSVFDVPSEGIAENSERSLVFTYSENPSVSDVPFEGKAQSFSEGDYLGERRSYEVLFREVASVYSLDWRLLAAIAYRESRFNPLAVGSQGEYGLMQILPSTWNSLAPKAADPFDPYTNVHIGAMYLANLRVRAREWGLREEYWPVVAYNWGPNNVLQLLSRGESWSDLPRIRQRYVVDVFDLIIFDSSELWQELRQDVP